MYSITSNLGPFSFEPRPHEQDYSFLILRETGVKHGWKWHSTLHFPTSREGSFLHALVSTNLSSFLLANS